MELWSKVQVTWSRKMPVWHPHRRWWTWWTWKGDAVWLCRSLGVTHISHRWVGRSSVIWERSLGHLLCLPYRASATWMHTQVHAHTCIYIYIYMYIHPHAHTHPPHIYTHMCMHTHTQTLAHTCTCPHMHTYPHIETGGCAQSGLRGWEPLVSQCVNCFSFLLRFLNRSQMSV